MVCRTETKNSFGCLVAVRSQAAVSVDPASGEWFTCKTSWSPQSAWWEQFKVGYHSKTVYLKKGWMCGWLPVKVKSLWNCTKKWHRDSPSSKGWNRWVFRPGWINRKGHENLIAFVNYLKEFGDVWRKGHNSTLRYIPSVPLRCLTF